MYRDEEKANNYGSNEFVREVRTESPLQSDPIIQAYRSSGACKKMGYLRFLTQYLEEIKKKQRENEIYGLEEKEEDKTNNGRSL